MNTKIDKSLGHGGRYNAESHPGVIRRALAFLIDLVVIYLNAYILFLLCWMTLEIPEIWQQNFFWPTFLAYLTILKPSSMRTIGYRVMKLKIVTLQGTKPSVVRMCFRYLLWLLIHPIPDILWTSADRDGRTLRDCFSGTQVLRADAVSDQDGPIHLSRNFGFCWCMFYPQVSFPRVKTASESSLAT